MELETIFYGMAIVFMTVMFLLMIAAVIAVFAIKRKIDAIHHSIDEKIHMITNIAQVGTGLVEKARKAFTKA